MTHERWINEGDRIVHHRTEDVEPMIDRARMLREAPQMPLSDSWLVGSVPLIVINQWAKEAGLKWDDPALKDVIKRKLLSGEFSKFRVREGTF